MRAAELSAAPGSSHSRRSSRHQRPALAASITAGFACAPLPTAAASKRAPAVQLLAFLAATSHSSTSPLYHVPSSGHSTYTCTGGLERSAARAWPQSVPLAHTHEAGAAGRQDWLHAHHARLGTRALPPLPPRHSSSTTACRCHWIPQLAAPWPRPGGCIVPLCLIARLQRATARGRQGGGRGAAAGGTAASRTVLPSRLSPTSRSRSRR